jgi:hypothetical protein
MEHPDHRRLSNTAQRMIRFVSTGDDESFLVLWNSLTVSDQRTIAEWMAAEVAQLRREHRDEREGAIGRRDEPRRLRLVTRERRA